MLIPFYIFLCGSAPFIHFLTELSYLLSDSALSPGVKRKITCRTACCVTNFQVENWKFNFTVNQLQESFVTGNGETTRWNIVIIRSIVFYTIVDCYNIEIYFARRPYSDYMMWKFIFSGNLLLHFSVVMLEKCCFASRAHHIHTPKHVDEVRMVVPIVGMFCAPWKHGIGKTAVIDIERKATQFLLFLIRLYGRIFRIFLFSPSIYYYYF